MTDEKELRRQLTIAQESLRQKNIALDAMHYVWCDGGCAGGVHRYKENVLPPLTEEIVKEAEENTRRLRDWFENAKCKATRQPQERK